MQQFGANIFSLLAMLKTVMLLNVLRKLVFFKYKEQPLLEIKVIFTIGCIVAKYMSIYFLHICVWQDCLFKCTKCVSEAEAAGVGAVRRCVCCFAGVWQAFRSVWRWVCFLRLQQSSVSAWGSASSKLWHRHRRPAVPVRGVSEQGDAHSKTPHERQNPALHRQVLIYAYLSVYICL